MDCRQCGDDQMLISEGLDYAVARPCPSCSSRCGLCDGDGYTMEEDASGYRVCQPCRCAKLEGQIGRFNAAHLPARFAHTSLFQFQAGRNQSLQQARQLAFNQAKEWQPGDPGLLFFGIPGCGKTHLMVGILRHLLLRRGAAVRFIEFSHLIQSLYQSFDTPGLSVGRIMQPLIDIPVLAIDELGKGQNARTRAPGVLKGRAGGVVKQVQLRDYAVEITDELVSKRYNAGRTTFFTTNFTAGRDQGLEHRLDLRIYSRLKEMCQMVKIEAPDYREVIASHQR